MGVSPLKKLATMVLYLAVESNLDARLFCYSVYVLATSSVSPKFLETFSHHLARVAFLWNATLLAINMKATRYLACFLKNKQNSVTNLEKRRKIIHVDKSWECL